MRKLRVGVVGVGYLGNLHAQKYAAMEDVDLVGIADTDLQRAEKIAHKYKTKAYESHTDLLSNVDGVSLAVPTVSHFEVGRDILNRGIHLLIEKPITLSLADADVLIETAKRNNAILQTGHIERFNPVVLEMESLISEPLFIECHRLSVFTNRGTDVDVVLDLMIHDLDIVLHLMDSDIVRIDGMGMPLVSGKLDIAHVRIQFTNGAVVNLTASRVSSEPVRTIRILQRESCLSVDYNQRKIAVTKFRGDQRNSPGIPPVPYREDAFQHCDPLAEQIRSFVDAIRRGAEPKVSGVDGRKALALALAISEQIKLRGETLSCIEPT
jgi:predicted dehydrogenase